MLLNVVNEEEFDPSISPIPAGITLVDEATPQMQTKAVKISIVDGQPPANLQAEIFAELVKYGVFGRLKKVYRSTLHAFCVVVIIRIEGE